MILLNATVGLLFIASMMLLLAGAVRFAFARTPAKQRSSMRFRMFASYLFAAVVFLLALNRAYYWLFIDSDPFFLPFPHGPVLQVGFFFFMGLLFRYKLIKQIRQDSTDSNIRDSLLLSSIGSFLLAIGHLFILVMESSFQQVGASLSVLGIVCNGLGVLRFSRYVKAQHGVSSTTD